MITVERSEFPEVFAIYTEHFPDMRGDFAETYRQDALEKATGRPVIWKQNNVSVSRARTIRGLHFSTAPEGQDKYVTCMRGMIWDVVMDVREGSPTFGHHVAYTLTGESLNSVFIPSGFAHGFVVMSPEDAVVSYMISSPYQPKYEHVVNPLTATHGINWLRVTDPIVSDKDRTAPSLAGLRGTGTLPQYQDTTQERE